MLYQSLTSALLLTAFVLSVAFSIIHALQELWDDGGPIWRYFGSIADVRIPDSLGFWLFTVGLTATLATVSWLAYLEGSALALGVLLGARVGDALVSHWLLATVKRPNPGLSTTELYVAEVVCVLILWPGEISQLGVVLGAGFFASIIPALRLLGALTTTGSANTERSAWKKQSQSA